jgi:hypothetical protein
MSEVRPGWVVERGVLPIVRYSRMVLIVRQIL